MTKEVSFCHLCKTNFLNYFQLGISSPTPEKVWLSDLQKDYNFVQCLEKAFEGTSIGNVKDFIFTFDLSYEDRCKILTCARASMAFMKNLSKTKPQMSLSNLRGIIEEKCGRMQPNMAIFKKVDDDIASGAVSFTLDSTLGDLSDVPQSWLYILETIGGNLVPETGTLLKSWKNIASACGYETSEIADFETSNAGSKGSESPMQKFLSIICTREPSFLISAFVEKLRTFGRNDIVQLVEQWQGKGLVNNMSTIENLQLAECFCILCNCIIISQYKLCSATAHMYSMVCYLSGSQELCHL